MAHHAGTIWSNVSGGVHRRRGTGAEFPLIDTLQAGQQVLVFCYSLGDTETFTNPNGVTNTSTAWDYVVTSEQDPGGFVADVFIDTGGDITQQLGQQNTCFQLQQRLM